MKKPMTRWKAAAIHLLISIVIITGVGLGLMFVWYGPELFALMQADRLLMILAIIDIAIGPLLTLVVFKHGKKSLKFDLTVIALLQAGFLVYGLHIMWQSRPVFLVGVRDRFELVFANQLSDDDLSKGKQDAYRTRSLTGPRIVGGLMAQNSAERFELALSGFAGKDIQLMPDRYVPYGQVAAEVLSHAGTIRELVDASPQDAGERLLKAVADLDREPETVRFVPITSDRGRATMLLDAETGAVLRPVAVEPWPDLAN